MMRLNDAHMSPAFLKDLLKILTMAAGYDPEKLEPIPIKSEQVNGWCYSFQSKSAGSDELGRETIGMAVSGNAIVNFDIKQWGKESQFPDEATKIITSIKWVTK